MSIWERACNSYHIQGVISEAVLFPRKSEEGACCGGWGGRTGREQQLTHQEGSVGPWLNWQVAWEWGWPFRGVGTVVRDQAIILRHKEGTTWRRPQEGESLGWGDILWLGCHLQGPQLWATSSCAHSWAHRADITPSVFSCVVCVHACECVYVYVFCPKTNKKKKRLTTQKTHRQRTWTDSSQKKEFRISMKHMERCLILFTKEMQFTNILEKNLRNYFTHIRGAKWKVGNHLVTNTS